VKSKRSELLWGLNAQILLKLNLRISLIPHHRQSILTATLSLHSLLVSDLTPKKPQTSEIRRVCFIEVLQVLVAITLPQKHTETEGK